MTQRLQICAAIEDTLAGVDVNIPLDMAVRRLEKGCFEAAIDEAKGLNIDRNFNNDLFVGVYSGVCYKLLANMPALIVKINNGHNIYDLAHLSSYEMNPDVTKAERQDIDIRLKQRITPNVSKQYKCRKCGNNETIPLEYQSRGGDEGSSFSIKCIKCEYIWRL